MNASQPPTPPEDPTPPDAGRGADEEEAARLLEAGLSGSAAGGRRPPPVPEDVADKFPAFEILEVLGQGGMGVVYKARQRGLDRLVALKVLPAELSKDPAFAERFAREARTLARLQHPHIVGVHEAGEVDGLHYLVMEYVDGVTLRQLMSSGELTAREALAIVPQICDALQYAHDAGVVHRDIKPENVLLDRGGRVKVADFGLAKLVQPGPADFTLTGTDQVMGTLHYMAPEQYKTPGAVDHRADIFSLGVVFYEMLTGELPVGRFAKPSAAPELDARIDAIVLRALERERELRYQAAGEVKTDLDLLQRAGAAPQGADAPAGQRARRRARRGRLLGRDRGRATSIYLKGALAVIGIGVVASLVVLWIADEVAEPGPRGDYHAAKAALWTGFGFAALALLLSLTGTVSAVANRLPPRNLVAGLTLACVAALALPSLVLAVAHEHADYRRMRAWADEWADELGTTFDAGGFVAIEGGGSREQRKEAYEAMRGAWDRYLSVISVRDLTIEDAMRYRLYAQEDLRALREMDPETLAAKRAARELGLPLVGTEQLEFPPQQCRISRVRIGDWQRKATVTVRTRSVRAAGTRTMSFFMQRDEDGWYFAVDKVHVGP